MITAKRNSKDTVFCDIFRQPKYLLQLYQALHPEDTGVTEDMLQEATIQNVLTDRIYNDLGFVVRDRLMILVEAQSTWSVNILIRALLYLAQTYQDRFEKMRFNLYGTRPAPLPQPEVYVIYTGERQEKPDTLSLSGSFFGGQKTSLELTIKVLYGDDRTIIGQYVRFCKVLNEQIKDNGLTDEAVRETIRICKDEDVLKEYLSGREQEAIGIMMALFDDEKVRDAFGYEQRLEGQKEGRKEGRMEGRKEGRKEGRMEGRKEGRMEGRNEERARIIRMMRQRDMSDDMISGTLGLPLAEVKAVPVQ